MLSPQLRRKVHDLWSLFWSSGLSNPLVAIEQITYLLFIRQLESLDRERVKQGKDSIYGPIKEKKQALKHTTFGGIQHVDFVDEVSDYSLCRWSYIRQNVSFPLLNDTVFPWLRTLEDRVGPAQNGNTTLGRISGRLRDAYFILDPNKSETLKRAVQHIDELFKQLDTRSVNADIMGDIFEHLLEEVKESGKNGQFRTPRHIIRFMVQLLQPELGKKVLDPACGSGGFLLNTLLQWKADHTDEEVLRLEWDGSPQHVRPAWPKGQGQNFNQLFHGYDNDRTMVRIAWMNLILHDLDSPEVHQLDALSKRLDNDQSSTYDYILANPPFTGSVDESDLSENRERFPREGKGNTAVTTKSELLFVYLMLDLLKIGGRAAVIVPDGVLFNSTNAHLALRRKLLFENTLEAVISLPANVFQPYSGVKTSILIFQKANQSVTAGDEPRTRDVFFYEINDEAYSLDQKRKAQPGRDNDLWDALPKFHAWKSVLDGLEGKQAEKAKAAAISTSYHQPEYWEERWRSVDDETLKVFPDKAGDKGHTYGLHELWPTLHRNPAKAEFAVREAQRPQLQKLFERLAANAAEGLKKDKAPAAAAKAVKDATARLNKLAKDEGLLDREFDQFGLRCLKTAIETVTGPAIARALSYLKEKGTKSTAPFALDRADESLREIIREFAKLDGYNVWCRSLGTAELPGKLTTKGNDDGQSTRQPSTQSWIVPVRKWAELDSWGEDPKTKEPIAKPTHKKGLPDPAYVDWLKKTLKVFDSTDATVKAEHRHRLDPDCLEALDFNLSAGRHKPFTFDAGTHRPPAEIIGELQGIHREIQERLAKLLTMVGK